MRSDPVASLNVAVLKAISIVVWLLLPISLPADAASGDHTVIFSSYFGGSLDEQIRDVEIDKNDNVYITGGTASSDFVTTPDAFDTTHNLDFDVFVVKFDSNGNLLWSTLIGGPGYDRAYAIESDSAGNVYVAGRAGPDFPTTKGVLQESFAGDINPINVYGPTDGFICKLAPDGALQFCTYFGASDRGIVRDLDLDSHGNIYVAANRDVGEFPPNINQALLNGPNGDADAVIAKISGDGAQVFWARYLGGSEYESGENSIKVDSKDNAVFLMMTASPGIATAGAYDTEYADNVDLYVAKVAADGDILWGTYLGGADVEETETHELLIDASDAVFVTAATKSADSDFKAGPETVLRRYGSSAGTQEIFAAKLSDDGSRLLALTFIGGTGKERPEGVGIDRTGQFYLTGFTTSNDFPVTPDATQNQLLNQDAFFVVLDNNLERVYASFLGGTGADLGRALDVDDRQGNTIISGVTASDDWPTFNALQTSRAGNDDGFVVKLAGTVSDTPGTGDQAPPSDNDTPSPDNDTPSPDPVSPPQDNAASQNNSNAASADNTGGGCVMNTDSKQDWLFHLMILIAAGRLTIQGFKRAALHQQNRSG